MARRPHSVIFCWKPTKEAHRHKAGAPFSRPAMNPAKSPCHFGSGMKHGSALLPWFMAHPNSNRENALPSRFDKVVKITLARPDEVSVRRVAPTMRDLMNINTNGTVNGRNKKRVSKRPSSTCVCAPQTTKSPWRSPKDPSLNPERHRPLEPCARGRCP